MHTLSDIAGDDAAHPMGNVAGAKASWVQLIVTGAGTVRFGDTSVEDGSRGLPIAAGGGMMLPYRGQIYKYALDGLRVYIPTGAIVSVAYED